MRCGERLKKFQAGDGREEKREVIVKKYPQFSLA
jgi:hypothetical protein